MYHRPHNRTRTSAGHQQPSQALKAQFKSERADAEMARARGTLVCSPRSTVHRRCVCANTKLDNSCGSCCCTRRIFPVLWEHVDRVSLPPCASARYIMVPDRAADQNATHSRMNHNDRAHHALSFHLRYSRRACSFLRVLRCLEPENNQRFSRIRDHRGQKLKKSRLVVVRMDKYVMNFASAAVPRWRERFRT
ncbi:unnamed protein product [Ectocarpus sp. 8 AP-2014]